MNEPPEDAPAAQYVGVGIGRYKENPRHDPAAPPRVVEHLLLAARGGEPEDETWYFTGRHPVVSKPGADQVRRKAAVR